MAVHASQAALELQGRTLSPGQQTTMGMLSVNDLGSGEEGGREREKVLPFIPQGPVMARVGLGSKVQSTFVHISHLGGNNH